LVFFPPSQKLFLPLEKPLLLPEELFSASGGWNGLSKKLFAASECLKAVQIPFGEPRINSWQCAEESNALTK
jgi:hypothetical protein